MTTPLAGVVLTPDNATVVINDDDGEYIVTHDYVTIIICIYLDDTPCINTELVIGFEKTFLNVSESAGKVEICVNISQPSNAPIEIKPFNLTVKKGAETAGQLYIQISINTTALTLLWIICFFRFERFSAHKPNSGRIW